MSIIKKFELTDKIIESNQTEDDFLGSQFESTMEQIIQLNFTDKERNLYKEMSSAWRSIVKNLITYYETRNTYNVEKDALELCEKSLEEEEKSYFKAKSHFVGSTMLRLDNFTDLKATENFDEAYNNLFDQYNIYSATVGKIDQLTNSIHQGSLYMDMISNSLEGKYNIIERVYTELQSNSYTFNDFLYLSDLNSIISKNIDKSIDINAIDNLAQSIGVEITLEYELLNFMYRTIADFSVEDVTDEIYKQLKENLNIVKNTQNAVDILRDANKACWIQIHETKGKPKEITKVNGDIAIFEDIVSDYCNKVLDCLNKRYGKEEADKLMDKGKDIRTNKLGKPLIRIKALIYNQSGYFN